MGRQWQCFMGVCLLEGVARSDILLASRAAGHGQFYLINQKMLGKMIVGFFNFNIPYFTCRILKLLWEYLISNIYSIKL